MDDGFVAPLDGTHRIEDGLPLAELFLLAPHQDDAMLDAWLASLTPNGFGRILDSLTRSVVTTASAAS